MNIFRKTGSEWDRKFATNPDLTNFFTRRFDGTWEQHDKGNKTFKDLDAFNKYCEARIKMLSAQSN